MYLDDISFSQSNLRCGIRSIIWDINGSAFNRGLQASKTASRTNFNGAKCATVLLTEMQVGKAIPVNEVRRLCRIVADRFIGGLVRSD